MQRDVCSGSEITSESVPADSGSSKPAEKVSRGDRRDGEWLVSTDASSAVAGGLEPGEAGPVPPYRGGGDRQHLSSRDRSYDASAHDWGAARTCDPYKGRLVIPYGVELVRAIPATTELGRGGRNGALGDLAAIGRSGIEEIRSRAAHDPLPLPHRSSSAEPSRPSSKSEPPKPSTESLPRPPSRRLGPLLP